MNVLVATDGSKYGRWGLNWVAKLPFVEPPQVTALHVLDSAWLRWTVSDTAGDSARGSALGQNPQGSHSSSWRR